MIERHSHRAAATRRSGPGILARLCAVLRFFAGMYTPPPCDRGQTIQRTTLLHALSFSFIFILLFASAGWAATPSGTVISNTATVQFVPGSGGPVIVSSNTVSLITTAWRTPSTLELLQYAPTAPSAVPTFVSTTDRSTTATSGGPFLPMPQPVQFPSGTAIPLAAVPLVPGGLYHEGDPLFIRLTDIDQNINTTAIETVLVTLGVSATGDAEVVRLYETGPNTGIFTGYIQTGPGPAVNGNGTLSVAVSSRIDGSYVDVADGTDTRAASVLVDPYGIVFDSTTGLPVNGVSVSLVDGAGAPATVYGDNGTSIFPATVVTGGTVTDSGGKVYVMPAGGFRFPFITPGTYRFLIVPPAGYRAPSVVPTSVLQALPGGPFAIVVPGSRGEQFIVNPGPALHIDIPVDPVGLGLWLIKTAGKETASVGDFVPYGLTVENTSTIALAPGVIVNDRLPHGFRYRKGSGRLNGVVLADPVVSPDGRGLTFAVGSLAASGRGVITYVAEVGAGAKPGKAVNSAVATSLLGASSNVASATVMVTEDLFRSKATIVGRVIVDGCGDKERSEETGLAGIRIFREDGTFVVTDKDGMYHFAAVEPGTHVVQIDLATVPRKYEIMACEENTRFAGSAFSQFVDVQGGTLWRADFHAGLKPKIIGEVGIEITTSLKKAGDGGPRMDQGTDLIEYNVPMRVGAVPARNLKLSIMLPPGATYQTGSTIFTGKKTTQPDGADGAVSRPTGSAAAVILIDEPQEAEGAVTFRFAEIPADWEGTLQFDAAVPLDGPLGELSTSALLTVDTPGGKNERTPVVKTAVVRSVRQDLRTAPDIVLHPKFQSGSADLSKQDKRELDRLVARIKKVRVKHIVVTGHTDPQKISGRLKKKYPDNHALSFARAAAVGAYLAEALKLKPEQVTYEGKGPDEPVASNKTAAGRARNRRVELRVQTLQVVAVSVLKSEKASSGMKAVATLGLRPGEEWPAEKPAKDAADRKKMPDYNAVWLQTTTAGLAWLWPPENLNPSAPITGAAIKHGPGHSLALSLNGAAVDPISFEGTAKREDGSVAVSTWSRLHLVEGDNRFEAVVTDEAGLVVERMTRIVHYSGNPVQAIFVPERSSLFADGKTPPVVAVRVLDKDGPPAREGVLGEYSVDPPHLPRKRVEDLKNAPLTASTSDRLQYHVGDDGIALIELEPTTQSGEAVVRIPMTNETRDIRVWLAPEDRDWILVGLGEGTVGYNTVKGNMESFGAGGGGEENFTEDGRVAFYAKGRIKGEWLLTLAYDSARHQGRDPQNLHQAIDPNKYYLLYGDGTEQRYDASSAKSLYVKLERGQFYALFGDYATGLTVSELSRYSRTFTGFKSEMKGERFQYNVFAAETNQAFIRDEIPGDGTSGLYHLSRKYIALNSERVTIEARDRFHSEVVVSSQPLSRHLDYTIDYESGSIFFKQPVFSRDGNFNPIFIVVEYESFDSVDNSLTYGGRGAVKLLENKVEIGATHVHEGRVGGSGDLDGVDATVDLGGGTKLRGEVAATKTEQAGTSAKTDGTAYLAEATHRSPKLDSRAYVREQAAGFGLGQQNGSETGTRKMGVDLDYRLTSSVAAGGEAFRSENLGTGAVRDVAEVRGRYTAAQYALTAGLRHAEDSFPGSEAQRSEQVYFGANYKVTDRTSLRFKHEQSVGGYNANGDYPTRTTVGVDHKLNSTATLFADQEWTHGSDQDSTTSRVGLRASPWTGGQISTTMEQQVTENGVRLFSTTGLKQGWQLNKKWSFDAGLDRSTTFRHPGNTPLNVNVPPASGGTEDFTAVSLGAGYREEKWSWNGRVERRFSDSEEKTGLLMGANGEPRPGIGLAAGLQYFKSDYVSGAERQSGDLRFGLAYRPRETRWIILDRLDYLFNEQQGGGTNYNSKRFVNNFVANYTSGNRVQVSLQYGAKYVLETIDSTDYSGYTDLTGLELRYDLTKRWDIGVRGSMLHSWAIGMTDYLTSVSTGFNLGKNFWISVGYNITGFRDRDFSRADFTSEGPFIKFRFKFDQASARDAVKWFSGQ